MNTLEDCIKKQDEFSKLVYGRCDVDIESRTVILNDDKVRKIYVIAILLSLSDDNNIWIWINDVECEFKRLVANKESLLLSKSIQDKIIYRKNKFIDIINNKTVNRLKYDCIYHGGFNGMLFNEFKKMTNDLRTFLCLGVV